MTDEPIDFDDLMARVRSGSPEATQEVFERYSPYLLRVVRRQLNRRMRSQYDSNDFLQAVWASFFLTPPGQYTFDNAEQLVGFLAQVAHNKVVEAYRQRMQTQKHNLNREHFLGELADETAYTPPSRDPSPSQVVIADERWQQLVEGQPEPVRRVLELLRSGFSKDEIIDALKINRKALSRVVQRIAQRAERP